VFRILKKAEKGTSANGGDMHANLIMMLRRTNNPGARMLLSLLRPHPSEPEEVRSEILRNETIRIDQILYGKLKESLLRFLYFVLYDDPRQINPLTVHATLISPLLAFGAWLTFARPHHKRWTDAGMQELDDFILNKKIKDSNLIRRALKTFFLYLRREGFADDHPFLNLHMVKTTCKHRQILSEKKFFDFFERVKTGKIPPVTTIAGIIARVTGLRAGEIVQLPVDVFDPISSMFSFPGRPPFKDKHLEQSFRKYLQWRQTQNPSSLNGFLLINKSSRHWNRPIPRSYLTHSFRKIGISLEDIRTYAISFAASKLDPIRLSDHFGFSRAHAIHLCSKHNSRYNSD
jgi:site-specific recombinase XerD